MPITGQDIPTLSPDEEALREQAGLTVPQWMIYTHPARFRVVVSGRRFGKTMLAVHELTRAGQVGEKRNVAYVAPTLKQAKRLMWRELKNAVPREAVKYKNETSLEIELAGFESRLRLFGADNADAMRGEGFDFIVFDEVQDIQEYVWGEIVRPALADRQGEALFLGTPKGMGFAYELFHNEEEYEDWQSFQFTSAEGGNIPKEEIEAARKTLSEHQFSQEFEASFVNPIGRVYSNFMRTTHVTSRAQDLGGDILVSMDFNVNPFTFAFHCLNEEGHLFTFDECELYGAHTQMAAEEIKRRYPGRNIIVYPDPSGRARRTSSSGRTDFHILAQAGFRVLAPTKAPAVKDRINVVQALLKSASGEIRWFVNPKCRSLIRSFEALCYNADDGKPDKKSGYDHFPDGVGYLAWLEFPLVRRQLGMRKLGGT